MKHTFLIFCLAIAGIAHGQSRVDYSIDPVSKDSFFLQEIVTAQATPGQPRPQTATSDVLFRSPDELRTFIEDLNTQAAESEKQAQKIMMEAAQKKEMALKIKAAMDKHTRFFIRADAKATKTK